MLGKEDVDYSLTTVLVPFKFAKKKPEVDPLVLTSPYIQEIKNKFLYTMPTATIIFSEIIKTVTNSDSTIDDIVKIIGNDPPITAKVINIANSAYYSSAVKISSLKRAVVALGFNMIKEINISMIR